MFKSLAALASLICLNLPAGALSLRAKLDPVTEAGYYRIRIGQELAGAGLHTLRLRDAGGTEIPYLLRTLPPVVQSERWKPCELLESEAHDSTNRLVVRNEGKAVSEFRIRMKGAEAAKRIAVRGSYDGQQWFGVKRWEAFGRHTGLRSEETAFIEFPEGDYPFYELTIRNDAGSPLDIVEIARAERIIRYGPLEAIDAGSFAIATESDRTVVSFPKMSGPRCVAEMAIRAEGKGFYSRRARIESDGRSLSFRITSRRDTTILRTGAFPVGRDFRMVIENEGNPPLSIRDVKLYGKVYHLIAYLEPQMNYCVESGDGPHAAYDLDEFAGEFPDDLPEVALRPAVIVASEPATSPQERTGFIWAALALSGTVLLLVCRNTLRDLHRKQTGEEI